jgi:hypothetical protein
MVELEVYITCGMNDVRWWFSAHRLGNDIFLERSSEFDSKGS